MTETNKKRWYLRDGYIRGTTLIISNQINSWLVNDSYAGSAYLLQPCGSGKNFKLQHLPIYTTHRLSAKIFATLLFSVITIWGNVLLRTIIQVLYWMSIHICFL